MDLVFFYLGPSVLSFFYFYFLHKRQTTHEESTLESRQLHKLRFLLYRRRRLEALERVKGAAKQNRTEIAYEIGQQLGAKRKAHSRPLPLSVIQRHTDRHDWASSLHAATATLDITLRLGNKRKLVDHS